MRARDCCCWMMSGPEECGQRRTFLLLCAGDLFVHCFTTRLALKPHADSRAEETIRGGVVVYLLIIGDRVRPCLVSSLVDFTGAHFLALRLAQRRKWLRLALSPSLTAS